MFERQIYNLIFTLEIKSSLIKAKYLADTGVACNGYSSACSGDCDSLCPVRDASTSLP